MYDEGLGQLYGINSRRFIIVYVDSGAQQFLHAEIWTAALAIEHLSITARASHG